MTHNNRDDCEMVGGCFTNPSEKIYAVVKLDHETPRIRVKLPNNI